MARGQRGHVEITGTYDVRIVCSDLLLLGTIASARLGGIESRGVESARYYFKTAKSSSVRSL